MGRGIDGLLNISRRSLLAQSEAIQLIGNNVANVNTEGYSRRKIVLESTVSQSVGSDQNLGSGVEVARIIRSVDAFLNKESLSRINDQAKASIRDQILSKAEAIFSLDQTEGQIGYQLSEFFAALEDLATNPSSIPLRSQVIERGTDLCQSIQSNYNVIADLQREADDRLKTQLAEVNRLTAQMAELNGQLRGSRSDQENINLLDERDQVLRDLAELINFKTVENEDGSMLVYLQNGFGLVVGSQNKELEYTTSPSFAPVGGFPAGLDGAGIGHVVYDFDPDEVNTSHIDLTELLAQGGGEIGGLLTLRGYQDSTDTSSFDAQGDLVEIGARIESIARYLLTTFNEQYLGSDEDGNAANGLQPSSGDLDGDAPGVYGLFTFNGAADSNSDTLPNDLTALGHTSYASILEFAVSAPEDLAAALDLDAAASSTSFAPGDSSNISRLLSLRTPDPLPTFSIGNFSEQGSLESIYESTVSYVGNLRSRVSKELSLATTRAEQTEALRQSTAGVNLDEEFASLINFQRVYQGSARLIGIADTLFKDLIGLLG